MDRKLSIGGDQLENILGEMSILKCRLEGKTEALLILSNEHSKIRSERDQFKLMAEQLRERYNVIKKKLEKSGSSLTNGFKEEQGLAQLLCEFKDQNRNLQMEAEDLNQRLQDAHGDIKALREQLARQRVGTFETISTNFPLYEKEELVVQLEQLHNKNRMLERDLKSMLNEKEELVMARDGLNHKVERLNVQLNAMLGGDEERLVDIDSMLMENRFLQERMQQSQEESTILKGLLSKYKSLLEKKQSKGMLKIGSGTSLIVTTKQVQQLLQTNPNLELPDNPATLAELRSLVVALFEALNDKSLSLSHQRKTNKILGARITDLEKKIKSLEVTSIRSRLTERILESFGSKTSSSFDDISEGFNDMDFITSKDNFRRLRKSTSLCSSVTNTPSPHRRISLHSDSELALKSAPPRTLDMIFPSRLSTSSTAEDDEALPPELEKLLSDAVNQLKEEEANEECNEKIVPGSPIHILCS